MARFLVPSVMVLIFSVIILSIGLYFFIQSNPFYIYYFYGLLINSIIFGIENTFIDVYMALLLVPISFYVYYITNGFFADIRYRTRMESGRIISGQKYDPYRTQQKIERAKKREYFEEKYKGKTHLIYSTILTILLISFHITSFM